jgi:phage/plasmid-associated DNA primase
MRTTKRTARTISAEMVRKASAINKYRPDLAPSVMTGSLTIDQAYRMAMTQPTKLNTMLSSWRSSTEDEKAAFLKAIVSAEAGEVTTETVAAFVEARMKPKPYARVRAGIAYQAYVAWCERQGMTALTLTAFGRRLNDLGIEKTHDRRRTHYLGLEVAA